MKNFKKITSFLMVATLCFAIPWAGILAEDSDQVKGLLKEGLELYNQRQYVRALDAFKQALAIDPKNEIADEYVKSTKQRIIEWESQSGDGEKPKDNASWDNLLNPKSGLSDRDTAVNAKDIIAARKSLVQRMKNRSTNIDNIVQVKNDNKSMDIVLFHDQLFFPGLTTLKDEALPVLSNVAEMIKSNSDKEVTIRSVAHTESDEESFPVYSNYSLPAADPETVKSNTVALFQDLESSRAFILFTYLAQKSMDHQTGPVLE